MGWFEAIGELFRFVVARRRYVLAPVLIILVLMSIFILVAEVPVLTPFIYAIF